MGNGTIEKTASVAASKAFILHYPRTREKEIALNNKLHFYLQKTDANKQPSSPSHVL